MQNSTRQRCAHTLVLGAAIVLGFALGACVGVRKAPPPEAPVAVPAECVPPETGTEGTLLKLDRDESELRILTYRGGRLAHLGHNHVIASRDLWGYAVLGQRLQGSRFALCVPVDSLIVDDLQLRASAGEEFASEVSEATVSSTRRNMLSETQLDGARHPFILVLGRIVAGTSPQVTMAVAVHVREAVYTVPVSVRFEHLPGGVLASGHLDIKQTSLGIQPYSALFGALTVRDELTIQFRVRAMSTVR